MKQEELDSLIRDAFELHIYSDMYELQMFFSNLADKYKLEFDAELFEESNNSNHYWENV